MTTSLIVSCGILIAAKWAAQMALEWLNQQHVRAHASAVPAAFANVVTPETYAKSVAYTLAKSRFDMLHLTWRAVILAATLFSGVLPWFYQFFQPSAGASALAGAAFLLSVGVCCSAPDLPFEWYSQFHLEERFGFNTTTVATWWLDRAKGLVLGVMLGFPLLLVILVLAGRLGASWWFWAWVCLTLFQLVMVVVAPALIMPLFNKFTSLPAGGLRDGLFALGDRAGFRAQMICLLAGVVTFWVAPVFHLLSRRHEYEADAYAACLIKRHEPLIAALRKLNEKNLSNLAPHPLYSGFYYSHPTLLEREAALTRLAKIRQAE